MMKGRDFGRVEGTLTMGVLGGNDWPFSKRLPGSCALLDYDFLFENRLKLGPPPPF
jgi:hypothetical protein